MNSDLTAEERYSPEIAEARYRENLAAKGGELKIGSDHELAAFIEKKIGEEGYSPATVVGEIKRLGLTFKTEISEKTIYNYIDKGIFFGISRESLPEKGKRKRKYEKVKRKKSARAPQGESIERRDPEIDERKTFGHWGRRLRMRKEKDEGSLVRPFGTSDAARNHYEDTGSDSRLRRGGAEQAGTPIRKALFKDIQKHYV